MHSDALYVMIELMHTTELQAHPWPFPLLAICSCEAALQSITSR